MSKHIKNISQSDLIVRGIPINSGATYTIPANVCTSWAMDEVVAKRIIDGELQVFSDNGGISGYYNQISFLLGSIVDSDGAQLVRPRAFANSDGFRFRGSSMSGEVAANSTGDIEYEMPAERFINGGRLLIDNIGENDKMTFQVVDKNNILGYGAGVVLDEFIKDYFVPSAGNLEVRLDYPAKIVAGLFLRLKYTSTHQNGCKVKCNLYLHWKAS